MARYPNGEIPARLLVSRPARGGTCLMMPGTAVKFDRLVALGRERYGWTPVVSGPDDAYRTRPRQQHYWDTLPFPQAAAPGTSSHGGDYRGRESGALDIGNWAEIGKVAFYQLAQDAGFEPNFFDWEPWHLLDWSPWSVPPKPTIIQELTDMDKAQIIHLFTKGRRTWALIGATVPGGVRTTTSQETVNAWALIYGPSKDAGDQIKYDTAIAEARALAGSWLAQQKLIHA